LNKGRKPEKEKEKKYMFKREKKLIALLLSAALAFTMNTAVFADVVGVEEEVVVDAADITTPTTATTPIQISADKALSENYYSISDNLKEYNVAQIDTNLYAVYKTALAFDGKNKPGKNFSASDIHFYVPKTTGSTVSRADLVSSDGVTLMTTSFNEISIKKVKVKAKKGATVGLDGKAIVGAKKGAYISSVKFTNKDDNKNYGKKIKDFVKSIKKMKTDKVSANGVKEGDTTGKIVPLVLAVYPAYAGNDDEAVKAAKAIGLGTVDSIDTSKIAKKKITGTVGGKKVTLKQSKDSTKPKGFGATENTCTADSNSKKATKYRIADGKYCGNIYY
jgi:hypothetical protein